jgi:hypothetical protein
MKNRRLPQPDDSRTLRDAFRLPGPADEVPPSIDRFRCCRLAWMTAAPLGQLI